MFSSSGSNRLLRGNDGHLWERLNEAILFRLFDFDTDWKCWSDMFNVGRNESDDEHSGLATDVAHYLESDAVSLLDAVNIEFSTDEPAHNLAAHVARGRPLCGKDLLKRWQSSLAYSESLATAMVMKHGQVDYFWRWKSAMERGNNRMLVNQNFITFSQQLLRTLLALNRTFFYGFGWLDSLLEEIKIGPKNLGSRFRRMWERDPGYLAAELTALFEETFNVIESKLPKADVQRLRRLLRYERTFWDRPPPRLKCSGRGAPSRQSTQHR